MWVYITSGITWTKGSDKVHFCTVKFSFWYRIKFSLAINLVILYNNIIQTPARIKYFSKF
jgi:hypothetical protein